MQSSKGFPSPKVKISSTFSDLSRRHRNIGDYSQTADTLTGHHRTLRYATLWTLLLTTHLMCGCGFYIPHHSYFNVDVRNVSSDVLNDVLVRFGNDSVDIGRAMPCNSTGEGAIKGSLRTSFTVSWTTPDHQKHLKSFDLSDKKIPKGDWNVNFVFLDNSQVMLVLYGSRPENKNSRDLEYLYPFETEAEKTERLQSDRAFRAIQDENLNELTRLLDAGVNVGSRQYGKGLTLLERAVIDEKRAFAEFLLKRGAKVGISLQIAAEKLDTGWLELLHRYEPDLESGAVILGTPLINAIREKRTANVEWLLKNGANPNSIQPIHGETPLHAAIGTSPEIVKLLLEHGAKVNTPPHEWRPPPLEQAMEYRKNAHTRELQLKYDEMIAVLKEFDKRPK